MNYLIKDKAKLLGSDRQPVGIFWKEHAHQPNYHQITTTQSQRIADCPRHSVTFLAIDLQATFHGNIKFRSDEFVQQVLREAKLANNSTLAITLVRRDRYYGAGMEEAISRVVNINAPKGGYRVTKKSHTRFDNEGVQREGGRMVQFVFKLQFVKE